jgi:molybdopterin-biosynthesis enzyme MoeA-like protein
VNFYSFIIGSEILNGRRSDSHFEYVNKKLLDRGYEHKLSLMIVDEPSLIERFFESVKNDKDSVMFCFGGIGATPDDYTRVCASNIFSEGVIEQNSEAAELIINQFGYKAYPNRIKMADIPRGAKLLKNVVNNVPGFYLDNRFFFMPGFPNMAHPMVDEIMDRFFPPKESKHRRTMRVVASENDFIDIMNSITVELSSLPTIDRKEVIFSLSGYDKQKVDEEFDNSKRALIDRNILCEEI